MEPQINISDYSPVSIVVRTIPEDYLKPYAGLLTGLAGKWNPNLKAPDASGRLAGWIFPKKNEDQVRETLDQIASGQASPTQSERQIKYLQRSSASQAGSPVRTPASPVSPRSSQGSSPYIGAILPRVAPAGYQQVTVTVIKPEIGQTLVLTAQGQTLPLTIVEATGTNQFLVRLPDGSESIIALETAWKVPGYDQPHEISRD